MNCPVCGEKELVYYRLIRGDLEAVCAGCGEHAHYVEVPW